MVLSSLSEGLMESWVSGLNYGSILTSRTETSSLSRVVGDCGDPCSVPLNGLKSLLSSTWPMNSHNCSESHTKTKKTNDNMPLALHASWRNNHVRSDYAGIEPTLPLNFSSYTRHLCLDFSILHFLQFIRTSFCNGITPLFMS